MCEWTNMELPSDLCILDYSQLVLMPIYSLGSHIFLTLHNSRYVIGYFNIIKFCYSISLKRLFFLVVCVRWLCLRKIYPSYKSKGKANPLQVYTGPEGSSKLKLPNFRTIGIRKRQVCQPYGPAVSTPQEIPLLFNSVRGWVDPRR
jgi:hypothetical protein